jgi:hypothetical protein
MLSGEPCYLDVSDHSLGMFGFLDKQNSFGTDEYEEGGCVPAS